MTRMHALNLIGRMLAATLAFCASCARAQTVGYDQPFRPQVHFSPPEH
jgi:hypothetical protein